MAGPLSGVRIIDLTEGFAGPFATKQLADFGADVIKIERPGGDPARRHGPFPHDQPDLEKSGLFLYLNTNKRSLVLDPSQPSGRDVILRLAKNANAVVDSFPAGSMAQYRLGLADIAEVNPAIVTGSLTPFGQVGPAAQRKATDLTLSARASWLMTAGEPDREPLKYYGRQAEYLAGLHFSWGVLVAIFHALRTGEGQFVDASMYEATAMVGDQGLLGASHVGSYERLRTGRRPLRFPPSVFPVADGYVSLLVTDLQWPRFCRMAEQPELATDPSLATQDGRIRRLEELQVTFIPWFLSRTKAEVFELAQQFGVPIAPFCDVEEVLNDPHFQERGFFETVVHPVLGEVTVSGAPFRMSATPWALRRPAPLIDEHAEEILIGELGFESIDLLAMRAAGVTG